MIKYFFSLIMLMSLSINAQFYIKSVESDKVLGIEKTAPYTDGDLVKLYANDNAKNKQWNLTDSGDGFFELVPVDSLQMRLTVELNASMGKKLYVSTSNGGANQQWYVIRELDGNYKIVSRDTGFVIDIWGNLTDDGIQAVVWESLNQYGTNGTNKNQNQSFVADVISGPSDPFDSYVDRPIYKIASGYDEHYCIDYDGNSKNIQQYEDNSSDNQQWWINWLDTEYEWFKLQSLFRTDKCIAVDRSVVGNANVEMKKIKDKETQEWRVSRESDDKHVSIITHDKKGGVMDVKDIGGGNGANIYPNEYHGDLNQVWIFKPTKNYYPNNPFIGQFYPERISLNPGWIGDPQEIDPYGVPDPFKSIRSAVGNGSISYQWQWAETNTTTTVWTDINNATGETYDASSFDYTVYAGKELFFRRKASDIYYFNEHSMYSNVISIKIVTYTYDNASSTNFFILGSNWLKLPDNTRLGVDLEVNYPPKNSSVIININGGGGVSFFGPSYILSSLTVESGSKLILAVGFDLDVINPIIVKGGLEVKPTASLTTRGDFENKGVLKVESSSIGTGSLITKGTITNTGTMMVERWIDNSDPDVTVDEDNNGETNDNKWHLVSSPVTGALSGVFLGHFLNYYTSNDVDGKNFHAYKSTVEPLNVGQGYVARYDGELTGSVSNIIEFNGEFNTGDGIDSPIMVKGDGNNYFGLPPEFNLVGNPYPSNLDWHKVYSDNSTLVTEDLYYYVHGSADDTPRLNGWQVYKISDNNDKRYIGVGQGFGVTLTSTATSGNLVFNNDARTNAHTGGSGFNKTNSRVDNSLVFRAVSNNLYDEIKLRFDDVSTVYFDDNNDAYKFNSFGNAPTPSFISADGKKLARCVTPSVESVDLGFNMGISGEVTFSLSNVEDFTEIILEDKEEDSFVDLMKGDYTFQYTDTDSEAGRFTLHFTKGALGENITDSYFKLYSYKKNIYIENSETLKDVSLRIYDLKGQLVYSDFLDNLGKLEVKTNLNEGIYLIELESENGIFTEKINITD